MTWKYFVGSVTGVKNELFFFSKLTNYPQSAAFFGVTRLWFIPKREEEISMVLY